jgi:hypothetical protein
MSTSFQRHGAVRRLVLAACAMGGAAYPTESWFGCDDARTIGISSSSTFMVRQLVASHQHQCEFPILIECNPRAASFFSCLPLHLRQSLQESLSQSADTSMSLVITGSVSGTIVSGTGATTGTYQAGETLTVSTSGSSGLYMLHADVDGFAACDFAT